MRDEDDLGDDVSGFKDGISRFYRDGILVQAGSETTTEPSATPEPDGLTRAERDLFRELVYQERVLSETRRRLHDRIDFIRSQGVTAETEAVLRHLKEKERAVSAQRKRLHQLIDSM
jgi:hypothetical protein